MFKEDETQYCTMCQEWAEKYKAKEQECEGLGQAYLETNELLQEKTKECTNLKTENEHLSEKEEEAKHYLEEAEKFKNCLIEIKEMIPPPKGAKLHLVFEEILKKINECEVENGESNT